MALALGLISIFFFGGGGLPSAFVASACIISVWHFSVASSGSSSSQRLLCILCVRLRMSLWFAWLSVRCVGARVLSSISSPSSPYSGE